jgi:hypothetical protein
MSDLKNEARDGDRLERGHGDLMRFFFDRGVKLSAEMRQMLSFNKSEYMVKNFLTELWTEVFTPAYEVRKCVEGDALVMKLVRLTPVMVNGILHVDELSLPLPRPFFSELIDVPTCKRVVLEEIGGDESKRVD